jgi:hypothetical protein
MKKYISVNIVLLVVLILVACSSKPTQTPTATTAPVTEKNGYVAPEVTQTSITNNPAPSGPFIPEYYPPPLPPGAVLQVIVNSKDIKSYTPDTLRKLPQATITSGDTKASGPKLSSILTDANIGAYTTVYVVNGFQAVTLSKEQINDQVIIGLATDGSLFLAIDNQSADQWFKQINQIWYK